MNIVLINHNIVNQKGDFFGTGIPYLPLSLAYVAGALRAKGHNVAVVDAFGENPFKVRSEGKFNVQGLTPSEIIEKIPKNIEAIFIYAGQAVAHIIILQIIEEIKRTFSIPIIMLENTQAVTAYSLLKTYKEFLQKGADYVIVGEAEERSCLLLEQLSNSQITVDGLVYKNKEGKLVQNQKTFFNKELDNLPFPAWDLFPVSNYWKLGYAHGPLSTEKYMPLLTSRGCPYGCEFCVTPLTSGRRWRGRSAKNVVDEIEHWQKTYGVTEFHIEDLNPTVNKERMKELAHEILTHKLDIILKIVSGTKIETVDEETLDLMYQCGFRYVSISPESGSVEVLKNMNKPFDHKRGLELVRHMHKLGVTTQACFVLGYPGETPKQLMMSRNYVRQLTKAGIDEVALFIMTPVPGSVAYDLGQSGYKNISELTFSPTWRSDYKTLNSFRWKTYALFFFWKLFWHPIKLFKQPF